MNAFGRFELISNAEREDWPQDKLLVSLDERLLQCRFDCRIVHDILRWVLGIFQERHPSINRIRITRAWTGS